MSGYAPLGIEPRIIAASVMGFVSVIGVVAVVFVALAFADAGAELPVGVSVGLLVTVLFGAAFVITRALTKPPNGGDAFFVGVGASAGIFLLELLARTVGYPFSHTPDAFVLCFVLASLGAFLGTYRRTRSSPGDTQRDGEP
jgi:drug/metabolite transporter (DMT)-like permease